MDLGLSGRVALVLGGSKGIGFAICQDFAREGARVFLVSRSQANVDAAVASLRAEGGEAAGFAADCMTPEGLACAVEATRAVFGSPDIAVYLPDALFIGNFPDVDEAMFLRANDHLILGFARLARAVIPDMQQKKWGRLLTIGSMNVRMTLRFIPRALGNTYRLAAVGLSKQLSDEFGRDGITVNTLGTGEIMTDAYRETFSAVATKEGKSFDQLEREKAIDIPIGRLGRPAEMAAAAVFLCSDRASFITGQTLLVDGGRVASPL